MLVIGTYVCSVGKAPRAKRIKISHDLEEKKPITQVKMDWIYQFQLFLFDFDGLLVDTERLHYEAYVTVLKKRGYNLSLTFDDFFTLAHLNAHAWKEALYKNISGLDPNWDLIYLEKKEELNASFKNKPIQLMEGVEELLLALSKGGVRRCVVTNSIYAHTLLIKDRLPILKTIPNWITREDYEMPKPNPECYLKAISLYGQKGDKIIGFEDSPRGFTALKKAGALACLICPQTHPLLKNLLEEGALHFESFQDILQSEGKALLQAQMQAP